MTGQACRQQTEWVGVFFEQSGPSPKIGKIWLFKHVINEVLLTSYSIMLMILTASQKGGVHLDIHYNNNVECGT